MGRGVGSASWGERGGQGPSSSSSSSPPPPLRSRRISCASAARAARHLRADPLRERKLFQTRALSLAAEGEAGSIFNCGCCVVVLKRHSTRPGSTCAYLRAQRVKMQAKGVRQVGGKIGSTHFRATHPEIAIPTESRACVWFRFF